MIDSHNTITENDSVLTQDELDILQEVVNIAFGKASADLADVVDVFVVMSVPQIKLLKKSDLKDYLISEVGDAGSSSVIEQHFWGRFKGAALIFFTPQAGVALTYLFNDSGSLAACENKIGTNRESVMEAGGILASACIGKIAECLNDMVTYTTPCYSDLSHINYSKTPKDTWAGRDKLTAVIKTPFSFDRDGINGFLMLVADPDSLQWLKESLNRFMERYG